MARRILMIALPAILCFETASCYRMRSSAGGGQLRRMIPDNQRVVRPSDIALPDGYSIEAVATGLTFPTGVVFDDAGRLHVVESGYSYGEAFSTPQLVRV